MSQFSLSLRRSFFRLMRATRPVLPMGKQVWVFRDADVREILQRDQEFTLRPINQVNIERRVGVFLLSLDDGPQYQEEVSALRKAVHQGDMERVGQFVRQTAREIIEDIGQDSEFEIVQSFMRKIPLLMLGDYFGFPGPDEDTFKAWNRSLFWDIFLNQKNDPTVQARAEQHAPAFNAYLDARIAAVKERLKAGEEVPDTFLARLLSQQLTEGPALDDDGIRRNMAGTLLGAAEPISKACVNILNQFFRRPKILTQACEAAQAGDVELIGKLAFEAFRLHPNLPVIIRHAETDLWIGSEAGRKRKISAGKTVYAFIASAMLDPQKFPQPDQIRLDRQRSDYLFFGHGLHTCFGNYLNYVIIPEMLMALLKIPGLRAKSKISYEGTFPDHWILGRRGRTDFV